MSPNKTYKKQTLILLAIFTILILILTISSTEEEIECYMNTDCGIDACAGDDNYCENNNVFQIFLFHTCNNPGQTTSYCSTYTDPFLIFDCGESYCEEYSENYCHQNNIYKNKICYNKGCADKDCFSEKVTQEELVKECEYGCKKGKCKSKETGKWRDYPYNQEQEPQIQENINQSIDYTFIEESIKKITIQNKETTDKTNPNNWAIILALLITAILIFILTYLLSKSN
ncbi:hypothetical protein HOE04_03680 [archaeon]|jgi:hypothetical protein|nr:hypothetical protein [archaeon]